MEAAAWHRGVSKRFQATQARWTTGEPGCCARDFGAGNVGAHLEFRILGPLEVRRDGALLTVGGPRQRALLALLLCNANRILPRDQLIDELLADQSARSLERMLRVQVSRLRKALADGGAEPRLIARSQGYLLRVDAGELDLERFESL